MNTNQNQPLTNHRKDFEFIASLIESGEKVLDCGSADGALLSYLQKEKQIKPLGIEKNDKLVLQSLARGVPVIQGKIDQALDLVSEKSFDVIILSKTIQQLVVADEIIEKMLTKGKTVVIAFLNYGYWFNRMFFLLKGRRPVNIAQPHSWEDSPDIRPLSIKDFELYCNQKSIQILTKFFLQADWKNKNWFSPNLFAGYAIYHIKK